MATRGDLAPGGATAQVWPRGAEGGYRTRFFLFFVMTRITIYLQTCMEVTMSEKLSVCDDIIPFAQFKTHASEWFRKLREGKDAVVITSNGRAAGVLVSPAEYDRLTDRQRFFDAVQEGLSNVASGDVFSTDEVRREMSLLFENR